MRVGKYVAKISTTRQREFTWVSREHRNTPWIKFQKLNFGVEKSTLSSVASQGITYEHHPPPIKYPNDIRSPKKARAHRPLELWLVGGGGTHIPSRQPALGFDDALRANKHSAKIVLKYGTGVCVRGVHWRHACSMEVKLGNQAPRRGHLRRQWGRIARLPAQPLLYESANREREWTPFWPRCGCKLSC